MNSLNTNFVTDPKSIQKVLITGRFLFLRLPKNTIQKI